MAFPKNCLPTITIFTALLVLGAGPAFADRVKHPTAVFAGHGAAPAHRADRGGCAARGSRRSGQPGASAASWHAGRPAAAADAAAAERADRGWAAAGRGRLLWLRRFSAAASIGGASAPC